MVERIRYHDETMQRDLAAVCAALAIEYWIEDEFLCTHDRDADAVSCLRDAVQCRAFPDGWHLWRGGGAKDESLYDRYHAYMVEKGIRYIEVEEDGTRWFLLGLVDDPKQWGIETFVTL